MILALPFQGVDIGVDASDSVLELLRRTVGGDRGAAEVLVARLRPKLKRWATGRLPVWARNGLDTEDLVQEALMRTIAEPGRLQVRPDFQAYMRQAILNKIRDHIRRAGRRADSPNGPIGAADRGESPLERLIGRERLERYEAALERLSPEDREAIVCRVDFGMSYREIAEALGRPTPDAARMAVARALVRLSHEFRDET